MKLHSDNDQVKIAEKVNTRNWMTSVQITVVIPPIQVQTTETKPTIQMLA
jgi:hypothetical protein